MSGLGLYPRTRARLVGPLLLRLANASVVRGHGPAGARTPARAAPRDAPRVCRRATGAQVEERPANTRTTCAERRPGGPVGARLTSTRRTPASGKRRISAERRS